MLKVVLNADFVQKMHVNFPFVCKMCMRLSENENQNVLSWVQLSKGNVIQSPRITLPHKVNMTSVLCMSQCLYTCFRQPHRCPPAFHAQPVCTQCSICFGTRLCLTRPDCCSKERWICDGGCSRCF